MDVKKWKVLEAMKNRKEKSPEKASEYVEGGKHSYNAPPEKASAAGKHFNKLRKMMGY